MKSDKRSRSDLLGIAGIIIAIISLIFGDNQYGQLTGKSLFSKKTPTSSIISIPPTSSIQPTNVTIPSVTAEADLPELVQASSTPPASPTLAVSTNTLSPSRTPPAATDTQAVKNYFEVNLNGDHRIYTGDSFNFSLGKWTARLQNSGDAGDSFEFHFPADIHSGATFNIVGNTLGVVPDEYEIIYTTISGRVFYSFGLLTGDYYKIKIETWDEASGIAMGEISGEIYPMDATPLLFSDGKFMISINVTNY